MIHWYEGTFSLEEAQQQVVDALRRLPNLQLWVVDSFQAYFEGEDDSHNMQMLDAAKGFPQSFQTVIRTGQPAWGPLPPHQKRQSRSTAAARRDRQ